jgi:hypothetical protein
MGLDQFSYSIDSEGNKTEIAYWRKHPNLQGWMENLWENKGRPNANDESDSMGLSEFNCVPVELSYEDLDSLEKDIQNSSMPQTAGFFFGNDSDDYYKEKDLEFIQSARFALDNGNKVYYDSWW